MVRLVTSASTAGAANAKGRSARAIVKKDCILTA
jgi:hypothetical protein